MADASSSASSRRWPPLPDSVPAARSFVRTVLADAPSEAVDVAELLVSELVTNAMLHAHTEVEVRVWSNEGRVHVGVSDWEPRCGVMPHQRSVEATTGRGLQLVELLATSYGIQTSDTGKTVWFQLWPDETEAQPPPAAGWGSVWSPSGPTATVVLANLPVVLQSAAQRHQDALLHECLLAALAGGHDRLGLQLDNLFTANAISQVISTGMVAALGEHHADPASRYLKVRIPIESKAAVLTLDRVLDLAKDAAVEGQLLTRPALPEISRFRCWLLNQIAGQLVGEQPTPWASTPEERNSTPLGLAPWDSADLQASPIPTVAADDGNRIVAVNAAAANPLGWKADDLIGQRIIVLIPEEWRERHIAGFTSLLLTGESHILGRPVVVQALHRDGHLLPVSLLIHAHEASDGRTVFTAKLEFL